MAGKDPFEKCKVWNNILHKTQSVDLSLLQALAILLEEASVSQAARRLNRSVPAVSRMLSRLRAQFGDPLLVRAGRSLVLTPRAEALRPELARIMADVGALVAPEDFQPADLQRRFVIRAAEESVALVGVPLIRLLRKTAPGVRISFVPEGDEMSAELRDGRVDLDLGVCGDWAGELRSQVLARLPCVGIVRAGHQLLRKEVSVAALAGAGHVVASRRGRMRGAVDAALLQAGLERDVALSVPSLWSALGIIAQSDLIGIGPRLCADAARKAGLKIETFDLPLPAPEVPLAISWHPRFEKDPAHAFLRESCGRTVSELCRQK